jgi:Domain of unknown function (DUF222)/HNH endonuclease
MFDTALAAAGESHLGSVPADAQRAGGPASTTPFAPTSVTEALAAVEAGLRYLSGRAGVQELTTAEQADCLRALARAESQHTAATVTVLAAFAAASGPHDDGHGSIRSWLRWQTRITTGAAAGVCGWMRRVARHPDIGEALAAGVISASWARQIADWTDKLPGEHRGEADIILIDAARAGSDLADLGGLAEEIYRRVATPDPDPGHASDGFPGRHLQLVTHFQGAGQLDASLTPAANAALQAVLDALGAKAGPEDYRNPGQRAHDALEEACRRLIGSGCLPERAGQATQIQLHMSLEQLLGLPGAGQTTAEWAGHAATAPPGADCDASIVPVVTGHVDEDLLDRLAAALLHPRPAPAGGSAGLAGPAGDSTMATTASRQLILDRATRLLSGPAGLAACLRTGLLPPPAAAISLPLDVGAATDTIPAHLRRAVALRDQHCAFPGCTQPPKACHVHHVVPRAEGGPTTLGNLILLCPFHHLVAVHRWHWTIRLNPDGTTTAVSPDRAKTLHSHSPPQVA